MKNFSLLILTMTLCCATSAMAIDQPYGWTVSASSTDPFVNSDAATGGVASAYLWLACCELPAGQKQGMSAAEFDLVSTGINVLATTPMNGFLNAGGGTNLLLAVGGCPCGPILAAELLILSTPGSICFAPSAANGILGTVDCEGDPNLLGMDWVGLTLGGGAPCSQGDVCQKPVSVESVSWGHLKNLYR